MIIDELNQALTAYQEKWDALTADRTDKAFFESLKPTAVGWKVADQTEYKRLYDELHDQCDRIIETWMNGRWIAKLHLREGSLANGAQIIKLMQRRPGSDDALGLDHVDFNSPSIEKTRQILQKESDLKWSDEDNDAVEGYHWISIWLAGAEAKLKPGSVLDIIVRELQELNASIIDNTSK